MRKVKVAKDVVLKIAEYANTKLKSYGATTAMSRTGDNALHSDKTTDLNLHVSRSNDFKANIFVSIHNNAAADTTVNGIETLVHPDSSPFVKTLASQVNSLVASRTGMNQRKYPVVNRSDVRVIKLDNKAWSILVEVGFLSNTSDASKLGTSATQQAAGNAIAEAIKNFMNSLPPM
ncbi:N-acetylmuramoyl-L-alanine amidase [Cytobacillus spongiae]|uniref:N-acetylmuramoyl-L-alanine amidase n=1 Tax=Cytobacillus spongiae TaxID=2901381 RepID=UPI001F3388C0|nr:N-acetylmuramoyl-L-alanine amidase [Cytobacillus spongiae]UII55912.1 N-acetylmuramoyl-L-alanine amidase [Cytobacillus spongiae]